MDIDINSGPVLVFLVGFGALLVLALNNVRYALVDGAYLLSSFAILIFGCVVMPIGFYYSMKSCRKKK